MSQEDASWYKPVMHSKPFDMPDLPALATIQAFHPRLLALLQRLHSTAPPISTTEPIAGRFAGQVVHIVFQGNISFQKTCFTCFRTHFVFQASGRGVKAMSQEPVEYIINVLQ